jgi:lipopolysaccharide biosynthesis protein
MHQLIKDRIYKYYLILIGFILRNKIKSIKISGLFDEVEYLKKYPEVSSICMDPLLHYLLYGRFEGNNPGPEIKKFAIINDKPFKNKSKFTPVFQWLFFAKYQFRWKTVRELAEEESINRISGNESNLNIPESEHITAYQPVWSQPDYENEEFPVIPQTDLKLIAFYLPQYHPFEENDRFWGKGFTEWTNVTKARPFFKGHYQPRLPGELGFYDLRIKDNMKRQIELAKQYGIHGFCIHHYFFDGRPVMRVPYQQILNNKDLEIPFCLNWANEPWTARFDGGWAKGDILIEQKHSTEDDIAFFKDIESALKDERYIRIDGRPLLLIYRTGLFPNFKETVGRWKECCHKAGIEELYIAGVETTFEERSDPRETGIDAVVEFPPSVVKQVSVFHQLELYAHDFNGKIYSYKHIADNAVKRSAPEHTFFRGIMPGWDNTARRKDPKIFYGSTPELYQEWLEKLIAYTLKHNNPANRLIFINAWNEWAECAYLEPDRKYGYAYLNATSRALQKLQGSIDV